MTEPHSRQTKVTQQRLEEDHSRQMEQVQRQAKADTERFRMRSEAEVADFRATISRLEVDLMKVNHTTRQGYAMVTWGAMCSDGVLTGEQDQGAGAAGAPRDAGRTGGAANPRSPGSA